MSGPAPARASRAGTANSGGPMKISRSRTIGSPCGRVGLAQLFQLPEDHVASKGRQGIDMEHPVQMVDLVLGTARQQAVGFDLALLALPVEIAREIGRAHV